MKKKVVPKTALVLSTVLLVMWSVFGAGTTIAWFTDSTETAVNNFVIGELKLEAYHRVDTGNGNFEYQTVEKSTRIFDDRALYEPGYTQVVYLRINNNGDMDFEYRVSVDVISYTLGTNRWGQPVNLANHLKFGFVTGDSENEINDKISDRGGAQALATVSLNNYTSEKGFLAAPVQGGLSEEYAALIIYMPEDATDIANYKKGSSIPKVELGITVLASQKGTLDLIS